MMLGYRMFLRFTTGEATAHVRLETELSFAHSIQQTLVPPIDLDLSELEIYGRTLPSERVGGELVDAVHAPGRTLAYLADVSGHGIPAGVLMGMVKTAVRQGFDLQQSLPALFAGIDRVLPSVKASHMYSTLTALLFESPGTMRLACAGNYPVMHYRKSTQDIARLAMEQVPLGLLPGSDYAAVSVAVAPGDVLMLITDGIVETASKLDQELGLHALESILLAHTAVPLCDLADLIFSAAGRHGDQEDDRTVLLVRILR